MRKTQFLRNIKNSCCKLCYVLCLCVACLIFAAPLNTMASGKLKVSQIAISIEKGKSKTLKVYLNDPKVSSSRIRFTSSNKKIATVSQKGKISAKAAGTATITAYLVDAKGKKCVGTESKCKVRVYKPASIKLNKTKVSLKVKGTVKLSATFTGKSSKVKWSSSKSSVAVVSSTGKVTGRKAGTCKIIAMANGRKATCTVTVKAASNSVSNRKAQHQKYVSEIRAFHQKNMGGYNKWLSAGLISSFGDSPCTYFSFVDIDKDGTDECIVKFGGGINTSMTTDSLGSRTEIYTIKNGSVKKIVEQDKYGNGWYPGIRVYRNSNLIEVYTSGHSTTGSEFFALYNGNLSNSATYSYSRVSGLGDGTYYVNGSVTTKEYYTNFSAGVMSGKTGYPMYRYTEANLERFL